jgi:hypothetical protein
MVLIMFLLGPVDMSPYTVDISSVVPHDYVCLTNLLAPPWTRSLESVFLQSPLLNCWASLLQLLYYRVL